MVNSYLNNLLASDTQKVTDLWHNDIPDILKKKVIFFYQSLCGSYIKVNKYFTPGRSLMTLTPPVEVTVSTAIWVASRRRMNSDSFPSVWLSCNSISAALWGRRSKSWWMINKHVKQWLYVKCQELSNESDMCHTEQYTVVQQNKVPQRYESNLT